MSVAPHVNTWREHPDPLADAAPPLVVDRRRIVHSATFRRLQHKTQVFVAGRGDHYRTRMVHTLEVADLARTIAAALGLNADLAETVALAHDLGHPPFGHAGERALDACCKDHGGFEHNSHSLRVVEYLEHPYPDFRGLNLTHVVRECLAKHTTQYDQPGPHELQDGRPPVLEGQVAGVADRMAYGLHDLQDGLYARLFEPALLNRLSLWQHCHVGPEPSSDSEWLRHLRPTTDRIRDLLIAGVIQHTRQTAEAANIRDLANVSERVVLVGLSDTLEAELVELDHFLFEHVYRSGLLVRMDSKAKRILTEVFEAYVAEPRLMSPRFWRRIDEQGAHRVAADYIAGMTDRYCQDEHARLFDARMET